jgi:transcriptional regulator with XRE-family HTH domain
MTELTKKRRRGRPPASENGPNPIDVHVGSRVRLRRMLMGISQEKLGQKIGLTFQQVQKYERGANRISAGRLFDLSLVLDVPISFFFDDLPAEAEKAALMPGAQVPDELPSRDKPSDSIATLETQHLVQSFSQIQDTTVRKRLMELMRSMSSNGEEAEEDASAA